MNLNQIGNELYGSCWQVRLAKRLDVTDRTIRRWVAGDTPVPPWVWNRLRELLYEHSQICTDIADRIGKA